MPPLGQRYREKLTVQQPGEVHVVGVLSRFLGKTHTSVPDTPIGEPKNVTIQSVDAEGTNTRCWDYVNPGPPFVTGGAFNLCRAALPQFLVQGTGTLASQTFDESNDDYYRYTGGFTHLGLNNSAEYAVSAYADLGLDQSDTDLFPSLEALGAGAYDRLKPRLERAGLGVALAEARDLPKMMRQTSRDFHSLWKGMGGHETSQLMQPKRVADAFLNAQFGWIPFLKDLSDFDDVIQNSRAYIRHIRKNNGKWVKRQRTDNILESEQLFPTWPHSVYPTIGAGIGDLFTAPPVSTFVLRNHTQVWYEGEFTYYRPEFDEAKKVDSPIFGDLKRMSTLMGLRINPSVIYKATPWTWLLDWFTNVGDTVDRITDWEVDGIVSKYMYLMHRHTRTWSLKSVLSPKTGGPIELWFDRKIEIKRRENANSPYGFSLSAGGLTDRQKLILAALATSRSRPARG